MHESYQYTNLFKQIAHYFSEKTNILHKNGINDIILDLGFGFSKNVDQNYALFDMLNYFHFLEKPILVGISRKSMLSKKLGIATNDTLNASTILHCKALLNGASIIRVHDTKEANEAIQLLC